MSESDSGSDYIDPPPKLNLNASKVIKKCEEGRNGPRLLQQQIEALNAVKKHFEKKTPVHVVLVSMPTGSGKTGVIACLPYYLGTIKSSESDELRYLFDRPILVIAPSLSIRDQLEQELTVKHIKSRPPFLIKRKIVPENQQKRVLPVAKIIEETSELKNQELLRSYEMVIANAQKRIVARRKQKVTVYSLWKENKTENEVGGCIVIEKNTNLFAEWKCLEREEKQVYYTIPINSHVNNLFDLISIQQGAICNFNNKNLAKTFEANIADFWFKYGFLL